MIPYSKKEKLWNIIKTIGPEVITLNHYELAEATDENDPELWKEFLLETDVRGWMETERKLLSNTELNKMLSGISDSHSVGQAQLINTLSRLDADTSVKEGPIFIYTYVPLNKEQEKAENVKKLADDPFFERSY